MNSEDFKQGIEDGQEIRARMKKAIWHGLGVFLGIFKVL